MIYTGIGSRETTEDVEKIMFHIGVVNGKSKIELRSGGADGSDFAFERGCLSVFGPKEIFLPWKGFGSKWNRKPASNDDVFNNENAVKMVKELAEEYGDYKEEAEDWYWKLLGRNMHQILGKNLDKPTNEVVCYTEGGKEKGGTRWAIRCAKQHNIKVYNLGNASQRDEYLSIIKQREMALVDVVAKNVDFYDLTS